MAFELPPNFIDQVWQIRGTSIISEDYDCLLKDSDKHKVQSTINVNMNAFAVRGSTAEHGLQGGLQKFGLAHMILPNFSYTEFVKMVQNVIVRQRILLTGNIKQKQKRDSRSGYLMEYDATPLWHAQLDRLVEIAYNDDTKRPQQSANTFCGFRCPLLQLTNHSS